MSAFRHPRRSVRLFPWSLLSVLSLAAPALFAAGPQVPNYNISDAVKDANLPKVPVQQEAPPAPVILQEAEVPLTLVEGEKLFIRDFHVDGAEFLDASALSAVLDPYRNRELNMAEVTAAANKVTVLCRDRGYLVARAYVPKQAVQDGVLLIKVIAGKYGSFQMKNHSLVKDAFLQGFFDQSMENSAIVTRDGLERPMLLVNDLPGARMPLVSIGPGSAPGTSDFTIETEAAERLAGYLMADNYGSRFTGKNRVSGGLDINSPFAIGDRISLSAMTSDNTDLQNGRVAYAFPLGYNGLRGEVAAYQTTYKLGAEYKDLDAKGVADAVEATLSYPLKRTREDSLYLSLNVANKYLRDEYAAVATSIGKRARVATLSLRQESYDSLFGLASYLNLTGAVSVGHLDFDDPAQQALNRAGANTAGHYSKVNLSFASNLAFDNHWSLGTSLLVQQSLGKNLDGSEQLSLSGANGIKSYPDGVTSDNGYLVSGELKYAFAPVANIDQAVGFFVNYGEVRPEDGRYTTVGKIAISDAGLAYYVSDKTCFGRIQLAQTLGTQHETQNYNHDLRALVQVGLRF